MKRSLFVLVAAFIMQACSYTVSDSNQFYEAQTYLPLPDPKNTNNQSEQNQKPSLLPEDCAAGDTAAEIKRDDRFRDDVQILPGMTIRIVATTYQRANSRALPIASEWKWTIPYRPKCGDSWSREDVLAVRQLLSAATRGDSSAVAPLDYFQRMIASACQPPSRNCVAANALASFTGNLNLNLRQQDETAPKEPPGAAAAIAHFQLPLASDTSSLGKWFAGLFRLHDTDIVPPSQPSSLDWTKCAEKQRADGAGVTAPLDSPFCNFSMETLRWGGGAGGDLITMPAPLDKYDVLVLATSGDPYLLFRPLAPQRPLDLSGNDPCNTSCAADQRLSRGFVEIQVLIPVSNAATGERLEVPVGQTVEDFERRRGQSVACILRDLNWLPAEMDVYQGSSANFVKQSSKRLAGDGNRVELCFSDSPKHGALFDDVVRIDRTKADNLLFAPGDKLEMAR